MDSNSPVYLIQYEEEEGYDAAEDMDSNSRHGLGAAPRTLATILVGPRATDKAERGVPTFCP